MRKRIFYILPILSCVTAGAANANWQYPGTYVGDGVYNDDGSRFTMSVRGGASYGTASIKNKIGGTITTQYYANLDTGEVISRAYYDACVQEGGCEGFEAAGLGTLADISPAKDFSDFAFAAGASIGWTVPNHPQWRVELGWDHITEMEYNQTPLLDGDLELTSGLIISAQSGSVQSKINTDVISVMAYYDFFDGLQKPMRKVIPYVGFGIGYADTETTMNLADPYGDLSTSADLQNFGELDQYRVLQFYRSKTSTSNVAGVLAAGVSYGIAQNMFLDFGARIMWLPKIKWTLSNEDDTRHLDWFSAENMIYTNVMLGLRFEF